LDGKPRDDVGINRIVNRIGGFTRPQPFGPPWRKIRTPGIFVAADQDDQGGSNAPEGEP